MKELPGRHRLPVDRDVLSGAPFPVRRRRSSQPCPSWWCSSASPRCTRAGAFRCRSFWSCPSACSGLWRRPARAAVQRCVFPDRPAGDHRARGEERHSDRGVRAGVVPAGREPCGRRDGSGPVALAAHPHDLFSFPHRRIAAGDKYRGGVGKPGMPSGPASWAARSQQRPWDFFFVPVFFFRLGLPPVQPEGGKAGNRRSEGEALENPSGLTLAQQEVL